MSVAFARPGVGRQQVVHPLADQPVAAPFHHARQRRIGEGHPVSNRTTPAVAAQFDLRAAHPATSAAPAGSMTTSASDHSPWPRNGKVIDRLDPAGQPVAEWAAMRRVAAPTAGSQSPGPWIRSTRHRRCGNLAARSGSGRLGRRHGPIVQPPHETGVLKRQLGPDLHRCSKCGQPGPTSPASCPAVAPAAGRIRRAFQDGGRLVRQLGFAAGGGGTDADGFGVVGCFDAEQWLGHGH